MNRIRRILRLTLVVLPFVISFAAKAQYTKLLDLGTSLDGNEPHGVVATDGTFLYGLTNTGGQYQYGTIYKIKPDGTGFAKLLDFDSDTNGSLPMGSLFYDGSSFLYGTTARGGTNDVGTIFKIKTDGTGYTKLFDFQYNTDGAYPQGGLISDGTFLYGFAAQGGSGFYGTLFKIKTDGTGYTKVLEFDGSGNGASPTGTLYYDGTFLYGTTTGGFSWNGNVFKVKPDGSAYFKLIDFNVSNGQAPLGSLISDGTYLYGAAQSGGTNNNGLIYKVKADGTGGYAKVIEFASASTAAYPKGTLAYDGTFLYGTTNDYGANGRGTIFKIKPDGTGYLKLQDQEVGSNGNYADGSLLLIGSTLFCVKSGRGSGSAPFLPGTVFRIDTDGTNYSRLHDFKILGNKSAGTLYSDGTYNYGMTQSGGLYDYGTIFRMNPDGTGFTTLLDFNGSNGQSPSGPLTSDGTYLYGATQQGGTNNYGVIFKILLNGSGYQKLLDFDNTTTGVSPSGALLIQGGFLYGSANNGGPGGSGAIFKIKTDGTLFQSLIDFDYSTNGAYPAGDLYFDGTFLYGAAKQGGNAVGSGTLFKIKPDGSGYAKIFDFDDDANKGGYPTGSLVSDGTYLYGMTENGGYSSSGVIFRIKTDGTGFTKYFDFDADSNVGTNPHGGLLLDGAYLYGLATYGGYSGYGTAFRIKPDGTGFLKLYDFEETGGDVPLGGLIADSNFLYGMTQEGGEINKGTYFKISKIPYVSIADFLPKEGPVGTYVAIYGNAFDDGAATNNIVKFNGVTAEVISATATKIVAIVPDGATTGPIAVTANGATATSTENFTLTDDVAIFNGTIKSCQTSFHEPDPTYDDQVLTFLPVGAGTKVKLSFTSFNVSDHIDVYDGPNTSSPLVATLSGSSIPADIISTSASGELTVRWVWEDASSDWDADITCASPSGSITIKSANLSVKQGEMVTLDLIPLITTINSKLDMSSLAIDSQPVSGALAAINPAGVLTINYSGKSFTGQDQLSVKACDDKGNCTSKVFTVAVSAQSAIDIMPKQISTAQGSEIVLDLVSLIVTTNSNLDLSTLEIVVQPSSGATATISAQGVLTINYAGVSFTGKDQLSIKACDDKGNCATRQFTIEVSVKDEITVYNAVSPNGKNPSLIIENIEVLPDTKTNTVYIYDRWENQVWHGTNYDNTVIVFKGVSDGGAELPTGVYYYRIDFPSGRKKMTGFISLRRQ